MMHRFFLKRLKVWSSLLLIPTGLLFICIMILTATSQLQAIKETTQSTTDDSVWIWKIPWMYALPSRK